MPVPPDPATVAKVSQITGGKSFTAKNSDQILKVYKDLGSNLGRKTEVREITSWFAIATARAARGGGRPLAALVGAASVTQRRAGGGAGTRPTPHRRPAQTSPFACRNVLAIDSADCLST